MWDCNGRFINATQGSDLFIDDLLVEGCQQRRSDITVLGRMPEVSMAWIVPEWCSSYRDGKTEICIEIGRLKQVWLSKGIKRKRTYSPWLFKYIFLISITWFPICPKQNQAYSNPDKQNWWILVVFPFKLLADVTDTFGLFQNHDSEKGFSRVILRY